MAETGKLRALLLGASGLVGGHCLAALLAHPSFSEVRVLVRRPLGIRHAKLQERLFDGDWLGREDDFRVDVVFCCLGTTLKKAGSRAAFRKVDFELCALAGSLAKRAGVETFAVVSAVNANPDALSFYARTKGELEASLRSLHFPRLILAKPSLLLGERKESRLLEGIGQTLIGPVSGLLGLTGSDLVPVQARDVARALVAATLDPHGGSLMELRLAEIRRLARSLD